MNHLSKFTTKETKNNFFLFLIFHWLVFIWNEENLIIFWQIKESSYNRQSNENLSHGLHNSAGTSRSVLCRRICFLTAHLSSHKRCRLRSHLLRSRKPRWGGFWSTSRSCWFGWWGWLGNRTRWDIFPPCLQGLNIFLTLHFQSLSGCSWQAGLWEALLAWASPWDTLVLDLLED